MGEITLETFKKVIEATIVLQGENATITLGTLKKLLESAAEQPKNDKIT